MSKHIVPEAALNQSRHGSWAWVPPAVLGAATVVGLLLRGGPSAVAGLIVPVRVDTVDRVPDRRPLAAKLAEDIESLASGLGSFTTIMEAPIDADRKVREASVSIGPVANEMVRRAVHTNTQRRAEHVIAGNGTRKAAEQRVLDAIAQMEAIGVDEPSTAAVGMLAGIDPTGGYFSNTIGPLSTDGLVIRGAGCCRLTDEGRAAAHAPQAALDMASYHDMLRSVVRKKGGATLRMLDALIEAGPGGITAEALGQRVSIDHTGGYFSNTIGPLSTLGLIERRAGVVTSTPLLFPEALA